MIRHLLITEMWMVDHASRSCKIANHVSCYDVPARITRLILGLSPVTQKPFSALRTERNREIGPLKRDDDSLALMDKEKAQRMTSYFTAIGENLINSLPMPRPNAPVDGNTTLGLIPARSTINCPTHKPVFKRESKQTQNQQGKLTWRRLTKTSQISREGRSTSTCWHLQLQHRTKNSLLLLEDCSINTGFQNKIIILFNLVGTLSLKLAYTYATK